jgi:hypothetical protein
MKRTIIAFSIAALIAAAPAALAQGVTSKAPGLQHKVSKCLSGKNLNPMNHL